MAEISSEYFEASDKIIEEDSELGLSQVFQWVSLVRNKAKSIFESENAAESLSEDIPSLMTFLKGGTSAKGPRVSTVLTEFRKSHVVRKGKPSVKARKSRQSSTRTPLPRRSGVKGPNRTFLVDSDPTPKLKIPPTIIKKTGILKQNVGSSTTFEETPHASFTPVIEKLKKKSSKRKSSELLQENVKKAKIDSSRYMESMPNTEVEKVTKAKNSSLLPNFANVSVLKENRIMQSKTKQKKAIENRKNMLAQRQVKLQQNKRTREEKLEKTRKERMKLEEDKLQQLKSAARGKNRINSSKEAAPKTVRGIETRGGDSNPKNSKEKEKPTSVSLKKMPTNLDKTGSSVLKSDKTNPIKKNPKFASEKREVEAVMNAAYTTNPISTSSKEESSKQAKVGPKSGTVMDSSKSYKTVKPVIKHQQRLTSSANSSTPIQKKGPESYAITPSHSSFASYDISEIRSDSEDEEPVSNSKPIPAWAVGMRLRNTLLRQHHHPIDTYKLFGNYYEPPDLAAIMGVEKKHYNKRTSSAIWNRTFRE